MSWKSLKTHREHWLIVECDRRDSLPLNKQFIDKEGMTEYSYMSAPLYLFRNLHKHIRIGLFFLSVAIGLLASFGDEIRLKDRITPSLHITLQSVWYSLVFYCFVLIFERLLIWIQKSQSTSGKTWLNFNVGIRSTIILASIIFICWLPYVLYLRPGVIWYDTANQLLQWFHLPNLFTQGQLSDQHPVFDTMVFGLFVQLGNLFGSGEYGIFLYTIIQAVITSAVFAYCLQYMFELGASRRLIKIAMVFVCFFPLIPLYSIGMVKESIFLPIFICFSIEYTKVVRTHGSELLHRNRLLIFLILSVLLSLTRKTGIYIVVSMCIILLFVVERKAIKRIVLTGSVTVLIVGILFPFVIFPVFNIQEGGKQEMLAIPFQQTARLMKNHGEEINEEQTHIINQILGVNAASRYNPYSSDPVKGFVWNSQKNEALGPYSRIWFSGLLDHPKTYLEAYIAMEYAWIAIPTASSPEISNRLMPVFASGTNHSFFDGHEKIGLSNNTSDRGLKIENSINWIEQTPVGMILFSRALWTTWMFAFICYEAIRARRYGRARTLATVAPYIVSYLMLWISSTSGSIEAMRYMIPQVFLFPLFITIISVHSLQKQQNSDM